MRATDPRYITHAGDYQRCDVDIPVRDVYELLRLKLELSEEVAKVWLTTAEMGSLRLGIKRDTARLRTKRTSDGDESNKQRVQG